MKKLSKQLIKTYKSNPATIAFLDGIFISAAINILTGMGSYEGNVKWIALAASITMIVGSIVLLLWQNAASKLQEHYKIWSADVKKRNGTVDKNNPKPYDWIAYIEECNNFSNNYKVWVANVKKENKSVDKSNKQKYDWSAFIRHYNEQYKDGFSEFPHYSKKSLTLFSLVCCICLLISVGLMIWSFI